MAYELRSTGHPIIDKLRLLQVEIADNPVDPYSPADLTKRFKFVERYMEDIDARRLRGQLVFVDTGQLYLERSEPDPESVRFDRRYVFRQRVDTVMHLMPERLSELIAVRFLSPDMMNVENDENLMFDGMPIDVPVLAIQSCRQAA